MTSDGPAGAAPSTRRSRRAVARTRSSRVRRGVVEAALAAFCVAALVVGGLLVAAIVRTQALHIYEATSGGLDRESAQADPAALADAADAVRTVIALDSSLATQDARAALADAIEGADAAVGDVETIMGGVAAVDPATAGVEQLQAASQSERKMSAALHAAAAKVATQSAALRSARTAFVTDVMARGMQVLSDYSDAERSTEDALYAALHQLDDATDLGAAVADADTAAAAVEASALAYRAQIASEAAGLQPTGGDVSAQLTYLQTWALTYNTTAWGDDNARGGDCVNFTSQGLLARGWTMDRTWYSTGPNGGSKAWILSSAMESYLQKAGFREYGADDLDRVRVRDVGIFYWGETGSAADHTMTVSKVEYTPSGPIVSFVSHNLDGQYRELKTALYTEHTNSTVHIYSIP